MGKLCHLIIFSDKKRDKSADMNKRKKKSALCLLRLFHSCHMEDSLHKKFMDYLLGHTKGSNSEEAWEVLLEEYGENVAYFKLFAELGGSYTNLFSEIP